MKREEYTFSADEVISIGQEAARVLQSPVFGAAYGTVLEELQRRFFNTPAHHVQELQEIRREGNALAAVVNRLRIYVANAEQEAHRAQHPGAQIGGEQ